MDRKFTACGVLACVQLAGTATFGMPRITIATPSFQQAEFLEECIRSVHGQDSALTEHIVVDGGSTDGSRTIIERHAQRLAWWCSEADRGQAHAINKALQRATGEVFGWINSDDLLLPDALTLVSQAFASDAALITLTGVRLKRQSDLPDKAMPAEDPHDPHRWFTAPRVNQQATFHSTRALQAIGGVEERLRYVMDYELWLQLLFRHGPQHVRAVHWPLAVFRHHARSKTVNELAAFVDETASVLHALSIRTGSPHLADVLAMGHAITPDLRSMPAESGHRALTAAMVQRFMLHWHRVPHNRKEFEMMRAWRVAARPVANDQEEADRLIELDDHLRAPNWLAYRARRKWKHLFG